MRCLLNRMTDLHKIWHDDAEVAERVSSAPAVKNLSLKIQHCGRPIRLRNPFCVIRYRDFQFQDGGCPPFWIFENERF